MVVSVSHVFDEILARIGLKEIVGSEADFFVDFVEVEVLVTELKLDFIGQLLKSNVVLNFCAIELSLEHCDHVHGLVAGPSLLLT